MKTAAIIILNHNKKSEVLECIESVYKQDYKDYKIIVVDNASTDGSVEAINLNYPDVHLIRNKVNAGPGAGRNIGWHFAEKIFDCKYLLFLDDDVIIDAHYLSKLISVIDSNPKIGIVCGKAYTDKKLNIIMSVGIRANLFSGAIYDLGSGKKDSHHFNNPGYVDACGGFGFLVRNDLFSNLDGFDENFYPYGWEDVDLCLKAKKQGYFAYYTPEAILIHKGTKLGRKPNPLYEKSKIKNYIYLIKVHTSLIQKITCAACLPFRALHLAARLFFNGNGKIIIEHFKGLFMGVKTASLSLKSNK